MSHWHPLLSHSCRNRLNVLLLSAAQNKNGKMSGTVWTFLGMLCTLSIAGLFPGSGHSSSPPCFLFLYSFISQHQYDRRLDFSTTSCVFICLHLVVELYHTHSACGFDDADVPDQRCARSVCWGLPYYHGQGNPRLQIPLILRNERLLVKL